MNGNNSTNHIIHSVIDVTLGLHSFANSQINAISIARYSEVINTNGDFLDANSQPIIFRNCNDLESINVHTDGTVHIKSNSIQNSTNPINIILAVAYSQDTVHITFY